MDREPTFEQAMARLEEIAKLLEKGDIPLDDSLSFFEEGTELVRKCRELLAGAEQTVRLLSVDGEGNGTLLPFEADE